MRVRDLFEIRRGLNLDLNGLTRSVDGDAINYVSNSGRNNGVSARVVPLVGIAPADAGTITISLAGSALETFLQPVPYYTSQNVSILTPRREMSEREKLWWVLCIRTNIFRYGFGRKANITHGDIELPDDMPAWCAEVAVPDFSALRVSGSGQPIPVLGTTGWRTFRYLDLFHIEPGTFEMKRGLKAGSTPFIGASARTNGITALADIAPTHFGGEITVSKDGSIGEAFYQPRPFFASSNLVVLTPIRPLSAAASLFLCALIRAEKFRFNYGRKWNMERMKQSVMRLPVTDAGEPDWDFMAQFIRSLPYSSSIVLSTLNEKSTKSS